MTKAQFWVLANLALLKSETRTIRQGFLESRPEPSLPIKGWAYLWTFTLPGAASLQNCLTTWKAWSAHRARDIPYFRGVRCFEPGTLSGRWHVHVVGVERFCVMTIRQHAKKYGWGRVNVRRIPATKAGYIAKYVTKSRRACKGGGVKLMGLVGFGKLKGISASDILVQDDWHDEILRVTAHMNAGGDRFFPWKHRENYALQAWLNSTRNKSGVEPYKMIKLEKKEHAAQAVSELENGGVIALAEYRSFKSEKKEMSVKERPDLKEMRVICTHSIELAGTGEQMALTEWMPAGTRLEDCKPTQQPGDRVLVVFATVKFAGNSRAGMSRRFVHLSKLLPGV